MRIFTGRSHLLAPAMLEDLRAAMKDDVDAHIVVVPRQLTLHTERMLLTGLNLRGSFQLQVLSPERLCGRIFDAAGRPDGTRVDERGRVMLVRAAVRAAGDRLTVYRTANRRHGFADRCARQLELFRQSDRQLLFVHIREPEQIARFRDAAGEGCQAILVRRPALEQARGPLGNRSDDGVNGYDYDHVFVNDGPLDTLPDKVRRFFEGLLCPSVS